MYSPKTSSCGWWVFVCIYYSDTSKEVDQGRDNNYVIHADDRGNYAGNLPKFNVNIASFCLDTVVASSQLLVDKKKEMVEERKNNKQTLCKYV